METTELLTPNNIVFCEKRWKIMAALLGFVTFMTFVWGFVILSIFLDENDFEDYAIGSLDGGMLGMINTAGNNTQLQRLVSPAVVSVLTFDHQGQEQVTSSGVIIHPNGYVLTTLHGINNHKRVAILIQTTDGSRQYEVKIIKTHQPHDLVLLKMITKDRFLFIKLADTQALETNSPVMTMGKDVNGETITSPGVLIQQNAQLMVGKSNMTNLFRSDSSASWQQGGGPMIDNHAEMIGLNLVINQSNGPEAYAVPADVIKVHFQDVVRFADSSYQQQNSSQQPSTSLVELAGFWWGKARELQSQEHQTTAILNPSHTPLQQNVPTNIFNGRALNIATPQTTTDTQNIVTAQDSAPTMPKPVAENPQVEHIGAAGEMVTLIDLEHKTSFNIGGYRLDAMFGLVILGVFGGIVGAFMPMGGSVVVVTGMMMFFSYGLYLIRPVIYVANLFAYGIPAFRFMKKGLTMQDRLYPLFMWIAVGVVFGYFIGHNLSDHIVGYLLAIFALAMAGVALHDLYENNDSSVTVTNIKPKNRSEALDVFLDKVSIDNKEDKRNTMLQSAIMGAPLGLLTGLIGASGGMLEVFYQRRVANISFHNALANASVMVFAASLTAAVISFIYGSSIGAFAWQTPLTLAMILVPSAFAGGILGHRLCENIDKQQQRYIFITIMLIVALTMLFAQ